MARVRFMGLSGYDTESMVQQAMQGEKMKVANSQKQLTTLNWQQESFRGFIKSIQGFQNNYLSFTNPTNNFRASNVMNAVKSSVTKGGEAYKGVSVVASASSSNTSFKLNVEKLAQGSILESTKGSADVKGNIAGLFSDTHPALTDQNNTFKVTLDGISKEVSIPVPELDEDGNAAPLEKEDIEAAINNVLKDFGTENGALKVKATISDDTGELKFETIAGHSFGVSDGTMKVEERLGISSGSKNAIKLNGSITDQLGFTPPANGELTINGKKLTGFSGSMSVQSFMDKINLSSAGVKMSFDEAFGQFKMESKGIGVSNAIDMTKFSSEFKDAFSFTERQAASDAEIRINDKFTTRTSNSFEYQGFKVSFDATTGTGTSNAVLVKADSDTSALSEKISSFVNDYNELLSSLTAAYETNRPKSAKGDYYEPLTDEEKSALKESELAMLEGKAKTGLHYGDSSLELIASKMRSAMTEPVTLSDGTKLSLAQIGISSTSWKDKGVLSIDEDKLKKALSGQLKLGEHTVTLDDITSLFSKAGKTNSEKGVADRLNAALDYGVSTKSTGSGVGVLINKAGVEGTDFAKENYMSRLIKDQSDLVSQLFEKMAKKEDRYYSIFGKMESAIMKQNQQMTYMQQQMG